MILSLNFLANSFSFSGVFSCFFIKQFKNTIFEGSFSKLLSAFAESEELTQEEADQIKELVDKNKKNG